MSKNKLKELKTKLIDKPGWCHNLFLGSIDKLLERVKTISEEAATLKKGK